mgnify:CR=1 FL=1
MTFLCLHCDRRFESFEMLWRHRWADHTEKLTVDKGGAKTW